MSEIINVWLLGGASMKISTHMNLDDNKGVVPELNKIFIDTSTSEQALLGDNDELRVLKLVRAGSGQVKSENYDEMAAQVPAILNEFPPTDINFVVFNGSGASGSTMGHVVTDALLKDGKSVVIFFSSTPDNLVRGRNTNKTLAGLDNLATSNQCVLPIVLADSTLQGGYGAADTILANSIFLTASMLNSSVVGLDDSDRRNFLNPLNMPDNQLGVKSGLCEMMVLVGVPKQPISGVVAAMTLVPMGANDNIGTDASTIFSGQLSKGIMDTFLHGEQSDKAVSLLLNPANIYEYSLNVEENNKQLAKTATLNARSRSIDTVGDHRDGGVVL